MKLRVWWGHLSLYITMKKFPEPDNRLRSLPMVEPLRGSLSTSRKRKQPKIPDGHIIAEDEVWKTVVV